MSGSFWLRRCFIGSAQTSDRVHSHTGAHTPALIPTAQTAHKRQQTPHHCTTVEYHHTNNNYHAHANMHAAAADCRLSGEDLRADERRRAAGWSYFYVELLTERRFRCHLVVQVDDEGEHALRLKLGGDLVEVDVVHPEPCRVTEIHPRHRLAAALETLFSAPLGRGGDRSASGKGGQQRGAGRRGAGRK